MPFNRGYLSPVVAHLLENKNITWIPCYDDASIMFPEKKWITPFFSKRKGCWESLNEFIASGKIKDDTWYQLAADDTIWHKDYWTHLRRAWTPESEVILSTQVRYKSIMYPCSTTLRLFNCDLSQLCIKGSVLADEKFDEIIWCADGLMAERLAERKVEYAQDALHYYNALRPSSWNYPDSAQPKPSLTGK